jgi:formylglycine-generating enzyme
MIKRVTVTAIVVVALSLGNALAADPPVVNGRGPALQFEFVDGTVITGSTDVKTITIQIASGDVLKVPVAEFTELTVGLKGRAKPQSKIRVGENVLVGTLKIGQFRITSPYGNVIAKLDEVSRIRPGTRAASGKFGQWSVKLRDKTCLKGMAISQSLRIRTRHGTLIVPLAQIQNASFAADKKNILVQCCNSDRIAGTLGPKATISVNTDKGRVDVSAGKIAVAAYGPPAFTLDLGKGVTMKLVLIPAGKFMMGSKLSPEKLGKRFSTEAKYYNDEYPQHEVAISKPFYMGVYEVTQAQWRAVMDTEPWKVQKDAKSDPSNAASWISWDDASKFCKLLSRKTGKEVSLPTEAQWEYACRAGSTTIYSYGDDSSQLGDYAWYDKNAYKKNEAYAHVAGHKKPNVFGLYDMHGNVLEWCRDWMDENFYSKTKNVDPEQTTKTIYVCLGVETYFRVLRGGSFRDGNSILRSAGRHAFFPNSRLSGNGFRVVISAGAAD